MNPFSCHQVARRMIEGEDRPLSLMERAGVAMHLAMCSFCRRFQTQLQFVARAVRRWAEVAMDDRSRRPRLSSSARERIGRAIDRAAREADGGSR